MPFIVRLFLNTMLASIVLFIMLALWGGYTAIRSDGSSPNYSGALLLSQAVLVVLCLLHVALRLGGQLANRTFLPLIYNLVALAVLPCARIYMGEQPPRREALGLALACIFTSGMLIRVLQSGAAP